MKSKLAILLCMTMACFMLSACEIQTPDGTLTIGFDETKKSDQTKIVDSKGNETVIDTEAIIEEATNLEGEDGSINIDTEGLIGGTIDKLLGGVDVPNGSSDDLKNFVYSFFGNPVQSIDMLLGNVEIPNGGTTGELKTFVYDAIGSLGIDLHDIANEQKIEETVNEVLREHGVDPDELEISVEEWVANMEAEVNAEKTAD